MHGLADRLLQEAIDNGTYEPSGYPEHDRLHMIKDQSQAIGEFLDFAPYTLCEFDSEWDEYRPVRESIQSVLANWFGIDEQKLNDEKEAMLADIRNAL